ncbi:hypothetical protein JXQ70_01800 [bacterium]|nr:hypothetical protein [bacterium]
MYRKTCIRENFFQDRISTRATHLLRAEQHWAERFISGEIASGFTVARAHTLQEINDFLDIESAVSRAGKLADTTDSGRYLVSQRRIARYQDKVNRLRNAGYDGEKIAELQGRIEMLKYGYLKTYSSKLKGNLSSPGRGHGSQGIDATYRHIDNAIDLVVLESKYSSNFRMGNDPTSLLSRRIMGQQMSPEWCERNIIKMITGPHQLETNTLGWELGNYGFKRYLNIMNKSGESSLYGLIFQ